MKCFTLKLFPSQTKLGHFWVGGKAKSGDCGIGSGSEFCSCRSPLNDLPLARSSEASRESSCSAAWPSQGDNVARGIFGPWRVKLDRRAMRPRNREIAKSRLRYFFSRFPHFLSFFSSFSSFSSNEKTSMWKKRSADIRVDEEKKWAVIREYLWRILLVSRFLNLCFWKNQWKIVEDACLFIRNFRKNLFLMFLDVDKRKRRIIWNVSNIFFHNFS